VVQFYKDGVPRMSWAA